MSARPQRLRYAASDLARALARVAMALAVVVAAAASPTTPTRSEQGARVSVVARSSPEGTLDRVARSEARVVGVEGDRGPVHVLGRGTSATIVSWLARTWTDPRASQRPSPLARPRSMVSARVASSRRARLRRHQRAPSSDDDA
ncbi:MAG: hypothetical protein K1X94_28015 [Sandaracinaceae bacterium]|nr:hypothetical protein [Sandaracinaceae bacterium]